MRKRKREGLHPGLHARQASGVGQAGVGVGRARDALLPGGAEELGALNAAVGAEFQRKNVGKNAIERAQVHVVVVAVAGQVAVVARLGHDGAGDSAVRVLRQHCEALAALLGGLVGLMKAQAVLGLQRLLWKLRGLLIPRKTGRCAGREAERKLSALVGPLPKSDEVFAFLTPNQPTREVGNFKLLVALALGAGVGQRNALLAVDEVPLRPARSRTQREDVKGQRPGLPSFGGQRDFSVVP